MPIMAKVLDNSPLVTGMPNGFMNAKTEKEIYDAAKYVSDNLGSAREYLKSFKEDDNVVSQLIGIMGQDLVYSVPIYNKLRDLGVSKYVFLQKIFSLNQKLVYFSLEILCEITKFYEGNRILNPPIFQKNPPAAGHFLTPAAAAQPL